MGVEIISNPLSVSALLSGEIDHHTAAAMRAAGRGSSRSRISASAIIK